MLQVLRQQVARQGLAELHVLEGEQLVVGAEVGVPLRGGLGQQFGSVDLDAAVAAGRGAGVANGREVERDGDAVPPAVEQNFCGWRAFLLMCVGSDGPCSSFLGSGCWLVSPWSRRQR